MYFLNQKKLNENHRRVGEYNIKWIFKHTDVCTISARRN